MNHFGLNFLLVLCLVTSFAGAQTRTDVERHRIDVETLAVNGTAYVGNLVLNNSLSVGSIYSPLLLQANGTFVAKQNAYLEGPTLANGTLGSAVEVSARVGGAASTVMGAVGPGSEAGVCFGGDACWYRSAADVVRTADQLQSAGIIIARQGTSTAVLVGNVGPASESGLSIQNGEAHLWRDAVRVLRTDGAWWTNGALVAKANSYHEGPALFNSSATVAAAQAFLLTPTATGLLPTAAAGNLAYDGTTHQLKVGQGASPAYQTVGLLGVAQTWTATQTFANVALGSGNTITWGGDSSLQRRGANEVSSPGTFFASLDIVARDGGAGQVFVGNGGPGGQGGFAIGGDSNLYREAASSLATDDKLRVGLELEVDGALNHDGSTVGFFGVAPATQHASIADPAGGAIIDAECRAQLNLVLDVLDRFGLTA